MWTYERRLEYPVKICKPDPNAAQAIISQLGGPNGELGASLRYLNQRYTMTDRNVAGTLTDIGTEELAHMEIIGAIVHQLTRNLTDEQLRAVRDLGGVVGLNAFRLFVDPDPRRQDLVHLLRHAGHMIDVMGIDHVGCGFDFCEFLEADTMASMTEGDAVLRGLEDCARLPALLEGLRDMGLTAEEAEKIAFGNFHRLLRQVLG